MTFWCGSGSGSGSEDPCLWLMDPDPDAFFVIDLQDANEKLFFYSFLLITKKSQSSRNQGFSYYFCLVIAGSGAESGSVPLIMDTDPDTGGPKTCGTGGSGSGFGSATLANTVLRSRPILPPIRVAWQFLKRSCCTPAAKRWRKLTPKSISVLRISVDWCRITKIFTHLS